MSEMLSIDAAAQTAFTTKWGRLPEHNAWQTAVVFRLMPGKVCGFVTPLTRLSLRLCYLSPVALLAVGAPIGGARGQAYTLSPNGGLLNPGGEIITLRPGEPTHELDRASVHRLGPRQHSNYLQPKGDA